MDTLVQNFSRLSHFFITNRPLSYIVVITLLLLGAVAFLITPKQYNPEIVRPAFLVSLTYEGATITQAEDRVVYELTEKIGAVPGVDDIYTTVHDGAEIQTTVIFEVGHDATQAKVDLITQLDQHSYRARGFVATPSIREINPETIPVLQVVFTDPQRSLAEVRTVVQSLRSDLIAVPNVSEVEVVGGYEPALVVEVDTERLHAHGVGLMQVREVLAESQVRTIYHGVETTHHRTEIVVDTAFETPEKLLQLPVAPGVTLGQVATVYQGTAGPQPRTTHATAEGREDAVILSVAKVEGSNAPTVTREVQEVLAKRMEALGLENLNYTITVDDGKLAADEIAGLGFNLLTSIGIVAVVLLLFLSARAAVVVLITIPLTFLVVFGLGFLFEQTINRITLFALILSLGLLVDAAIVVTESVYTYLQRSSSATESEKEWGIASAVGSVSLGLLLSLVTSVIVFLPLNYITGMMGPYMGPIAFFVPVALTVSFIIAIVVTPFVASRVITVEKDPRGPSRIMQSALSWIIDRYRVFLQRVLSDRKSQRRIVRGAFFAFFVSLLLPLLTFVHFQMLPGADQNQIYVYVDLPVDQSVVSTAVQTAQLEDVLLRHSEVVSTQAFVGQAPIIDFNGLFKGAQNRINPWQATVRVNLTDQSSRRSDSETITQELRSLAARSPEIDTAHVRFLEEPPGPPVRATVEARVYSDDPELRELVASNLFERISNIAGVTDRYVDQGDAVGRLVLTPIPEALQRYGVHMSDIHQEIALLGGPQVVGEYRTSLANEYAPLLLSLSTNVTPADRLALSTVAVTAADGAVVPLGSVVTTEYEARPSWRTYESGQVFTGVTAELGDRSVVYVMIDLIADLVQSGLDGVTVTEWGLFGMTLETPEGAAVYLAWGGEWQMTLENFRDLGIAMGVALLLVYAVLVGRYQRFSTPALILMTVPLGLIGILWGFTLLDQLFGVYLTATALIGFIALIGIVVNNAIIYLEYVEQSMRAGLAWREALVEAGTQRLRPILLTSLTTVLASLTIAFDPVWSGLAWAIVFGLSASTALTLVMYPVLLVYYQTPEETKESRKV